MGELLLSLLFIFLSNKFSHQNEPPNKEVPHTVVTRTCLFHISNIIKRRRRLVNLLILTHNAHQIKDILPRIFYNSPPMHYRQNVDPQRRSLVTINQYLALSTFFRKLAIKSKRCWKKLSSYILGST